MSTEFKILTGYISTPLFSLKISLENNYILFVHWNIFKDKKNSYLPTLRPRYILFDSNNIRVSLKELELKQDVVFKEIILSDKDLGLLEKMHNRTNNQLYFKMFIYDNFVDWLKTNFKEMINSGKFKILNNNELDF